MKFSVEQSVPMMLSGHDLCMTQSLLLLLLNLLLTFLLLSLWALYFAIGVLHGYLDCYVAWLQ